MATASKTEDAGVVKISEQGVVVIPIEVRKVLGIDKKEAFIRIGHVSVAKMIDNGEPSEGTESTGLVKISDQGVVNIPVAVRRVLDIDGTGAFLRIQDISVAEVISGGDGGGDE